MLYLFGVNTERYDNGIMRRHSTHRIGSKLSVSNSKLLKFALIFLLDIKHFQI